MPSPFPGMDPYIEADGIWGDFHSALISELRRALNSVLPKGFFARSEVFVWIHEPDARTRRLGRPDVTVTDSPRSRGAAPTAALPHAEPMVVPLPVWDEEEQTYIRIIETATDRVVAVIEVLSPINKTPGAGWEAYSGKRNECLRSQVNFVEIDLLKGGRRLPLGAPYPECDCCVLIHRPADRDTARIWPMLIADPLPVIPVPLNDALEVPLDLRDCADRAYDAGRYADLLRYDRALPVPPWSEPQSAWAVPFAGEGVRRSTDA